MAQARTKREMKAAVTRGIKVWLGLLPEESIAVIRRKKSGWRDSFQIFFKTRFETRFKGRKKTWLMLDNEQTIFRRSCYACSCLGYSHDTMVRSMLINTCVANTAHKIGESWCLNSMIWGTWNVVPIAQKNIKHLKIQTQRINTSLRSRLQRKQSSVIPKYFDYWSRYHWSLWLLSQGRGLGWGRRQRRLRAPGG